MVDPQVAPLTRRALLQRGGLGVAALLALSACGGQKAEDKPLPSSGSRLDEVQAEALAVARFGVYRRETASISFTFPGGEPDRGEADVDFVNHVAYGEFGAEKTPMAWTMHRVATATGTPVDDPKNWSGRALDPQSAPFDVLLSLILNLASDRPENPQLLQQTDAMYLGKRELFGQQCLVIKGPSQQTAATASAAPSPSGDEGSRTRYWIGKDNQLLRFEAYLGDAQGRLAAINFDPRLPKPDPIPQFVHPILQLTEVSASPDVTASPAS